MLLIKKAVTDFVPDAAQWVKKLTLRHTWLENKIFRGLAEDDDDGLNEQAEKLNTDIFPNPRDGGESPRFGSGGEGEGIALGSIVVRGTQATT